MAIFKGSRYEKIPITTIIDSTTGVRKEFFNLRTQFTIDDIGEDFQLHTVIKGEELDHIAAQYGERSVYWWIIAEVNGLDFPFDLQPGQQLVIPSKKLFDRL